MSIEHIERQSLTLAEQAAAVIIHDQAGYDSAAGLLTAIKHMRRAAEDHHRPVIDAAHKSHQAALKALRSIDTPLQAAEATVKRAIEAWDDEQARRRAEQQRAIDEAARKAAELELEAEIEAAEADGAGAAEIQAIITEAEAVVQVAPLAPPTYQRAANIRIGTRRVPEVYDKMALIRHVAANPGMAYLVEENMVALRKLASAAGDLLNLPGVRLVEIKTTAVR